ncbi:BAR-domain-containing protein [Durotheca rogersii]|uniref:BAR-domain-containing protein n=1 Tax=Durotheca rogersii TaxID=419775 RepID=UPI00221E886A|nr:BAR-domain-containing protein [Durotheca rogersii]KAI5865213.1 BAR-domain-containing protein [Durotheca rogersii]
MNFTKKIDRAFQWAGEKMGQEAKTSHSDEFRNLENEMALRHEGYERLQKSMNAYVKSLSRRGESFEDKEKGLPISYLGRTMMSHGEDFEPDSEFGNCLIAMGRANERIAGIQETYVAHSTSYWLEGLERSLAMMKEYQSARKKLESRRLAYDASMAKMQKNKREDFRLEDELRTAKAKYEESSEDVLRRMQDIKEAEADSVRDLTSFLECELDYYERCAEELRRVRQEWAAGQATAPGGPRPSELSVSRRTATRSRSNTAQSATGHNDRTERRASRRDSREREEPAPEPVRMPIRSSRAVTPEASRPGISRTSTYSGTFDRSSSQSSYREPPLPPPEGLRKTPTAPPPDVVTLRNNLRPVNRVQTSQNLSPNVYIDDYDTTTSSGSPEYDRSESPATSHGSLSRSTSNSALRTVGGVKKAPPPPPSRAKKPAPPIPARRETGY